MLSDRAIRARLHLNDGLIISPFCERAIAHGRSYGLAAASYDVRLAQDIWLWPFWGRLGSIIEYLSFPADISGEVKDKSSNARKFILVQNTFIDPGWRGYLTVELTRLLPWPIKLRAGTPIAQIVFHQLDQPSGHPYRGKYLNQKAAPQKALVDE